MKKLKFKKIDAFATTKSDGNPAGYIYLNSLSELNRSEMHKIAMELKGFVNEVGFVAKTSETSFSLKFYSSECEVDFCGHATIAIMYDIIKNDDKLKQLEIIEIQTNRGKLSVKNQIVNEDAVYIMSPVPIFDEKKINIVETAKALRIPRSSILLDEPLSIINAGLSTLIVPLNSIESILDISPGFEELKTFCFESGVDIIEVYTEHVIDVHSNYRVRVFAPKYGYLEDPATGSGNSALGYYLMSKKKFETEMITVEQNGNRNKFNIVKLRKEKDSEDNYRVLFGGGALTRIEGSYFLQ